MDTQLKKKVCFVISPIGEEDSETRKRSDQVLKHIITDAVKQLDYEVIRADKISEPGIITTQIIQYIVDSELVIADLTEKNPNVFYELAIRHATRKPLVQLIKKGETIPFDVAATRIIQFDIHNLDSVASAKEEIILQINSLESGKGEVNNPISASFDLKMLKESNNEEDRSIADVLVAISDLRLAITSVDKKVMNTELSKSVLADENKKLIDIVSRIEERIDTQNRRKRRFHPMMIEEFMHLGFERGNDNIGFLFYVSIFKDDFPWIYEIGMETYRGLQSTKSNVEKKKLINQFIEVTELTMQHPMIRELCGESKEMYMLSKEMPHFMKRFLEKYYMNEK